MICDINVIFGFGITYQIGVCSQLSKFGLFYVICIKNKNNVSENYYYKKINIQ